MIVPFYKTRGWVFISYGLTHCGHSSHHRAIIFITEPYCWSEDGLFLKASSFFWLTPKILQSPTFPLGMGMDFIFLSKSQQVSRWVTDTGRGVWISFWLCIQITLEIQLIPQFSPPLKLFFYFYAIITLLSLDSIVYGLLWVLSKYFVDWRKKNRITFSHLTVDGGLSFKIQPF